jgi:hypothetical protein
MITKVETDKRPDTTTTTQTPDNQEDNTPGAISDGEMVIE